MPLQKIVRFNRQSKTCTKREVDSQNIIFFDRQSCKNMDTLKLECPFNWIENVELAEKFDESQELKISIWEEPVLSFMDDIMIVYVRTMQKNFEQAEEKLQEIDEIWKSLDKEEIQKENVSVNVLRHIVQATKYYVYEKKGNELGMEEVLKEIEDPEKFKKMLVDSSTIDGCKAIAWSTFHESQCQKAIAYAQSAIEQNSDCPLWYYLLSKNLRRERRRFNHSASPSSEEFGSISKCYELSSRDYYKLLYAQTLHDRREYGESKKMYLEIYESNPASVNIQLRLALAFIRDGRYVEAKSCLDYAEKHRPENQMFLHYKGIYMKQVEKDLESAMDYFKKSAEFLNFPADITYARCLVELNRVSECIQHLSVMLTKYKDDANNKQKILLDIAMLSCKKNDYDKASTNFLEAILLDKESSLLQWFKNELDNGRCYNIFSFVKNEVLPKLKETLNNFNDPEYVIILKLEELCKSEVREPEEQCSEHHFEYKKNRRSTRSRYRSSSTSTNSRSERSRSNRSRRSNPSRDRQYSSNNETEWSPPREPRKSFPKKKETFHSPDHEAGWSPSPHSPLKDESGWSPARSSSGKNEVASSPTQNYPVGAEVERSLPQPFSAKKKLDYSLAGPSSVKDEDGWSPPQQCPAKGEAGLSPAPPSPAKGDGGWSPTQNCQAEAGLSPAQVSPAKSNARWSPAQNSPAKDETLATPCNEGEWSPSSNKNCLSYPLKDISPSTDKPECLQLGEHSQSFSPKEQCFTPMDQRKVYPIDQPNLISSPKEETTLTSPKKIDYSSSEQFNRSFQAENQNSSLTTDQTKFVNPGSPSRKVQTFTPPTDYQVEELPLNNENQSTLMDQCFPSFPNKQEILSTENATESPILLSSLEDNVLPAADQDEWSPPDQANQCSVKMDQSCPSFPNKQEILSTENATESPILPSSLENEVSQAAGQDEWSPPHQANLSSVHTDKASSATDQEEWVPLNRRRQSSPDQNRTFSSDNNQRVWSSSGNRSRPSQFRDQSFSVPRYEFGRSRTGQPGRSNFNTEKISSSDSQAECSPSGQPCKSSSVADNASMSDQDEWVPLHRQRQSSPLRNQTYSSGNNQRGWRSSGDRPRLLQSRNQNFASNNNQTRYSFSRNRSQSPLSKDEVEASTDQEWKPSGPPHRSYFNEMDQSNSQSDANSSDYNPRRPKQFGRNNPYQRGNRQNFSSQRRGNRFPHQRNKYESR